VAAYAGVVLLWAATEMRSTERGHRRPAALAVRFAPVLAFGAMLLVRHALTARGVDESQSGAVLGRFYTDELGGALLPALKPMIKVMLSLSIALAFGVAIAPAMALLDGWRERSADRRRLWLAVLAICVAGVYVLAAARHTMVINRDPKIHERYLFAVGPLFLALLLTGARSVVRRRADRGRMCRARRGGRTDRGHPAAAQHVGERAEPHALVAGVHQDPQPVAVALLMPRRRRPSAGARARGSACAAHCASARSPPRSWC
jgi:hypothetical protein